MTYTHYLFLIVTLLFCKSCFAENITLDLRNVPLQDAIHILAKFTQRNVIINPDIKGNVTLHLVDVTPDKAFSSLLTSNHLVKIDNNGVWMITTAVSWNKTKQDQLKFKHIEEETTPLRLRIWQIRYAKASDMALILQNTKHNFLSKRGQMTVDPRTNSISISDYSDHLKMIDRLIHQFDIPVKQVLIEAKVVSMDKDCEQALGIRFEQGFQANDQELTLKPNRGNGFNIATIPLTANPIEVKLDALERSGHSDILSSPRLLTGNQQTAFIEAGEEIPYQETTSSGATSITFKKAVLSLKVTPQIMANKKILLQLKVNQDKPSKRMVLGVPAINTRQINTQIELKDGETAVLGGIFEMNEENIQQGFPFLDKIPVIGFIFRSQNVTNTKRELLIFVTPKIILG